MLKHYMTCELCGDVERVNDCQDAQEEYRRIASLERITVFIEPRSVRLDDRHHANIDCRLFDLRKLNKSRDLCKTCRGHIIESLKDAFQKALEERGAHRPPEAPEEAE